jgi:hypothetical protein
MNQAGCQISSMLSDSIKKLVTLGVEVKVQNKIISQEVNKSFFLIFFLSSLPIHLTPVLFLDVFSDGCRVKFPLR